MNALEQMTARQLYRGILQKARTYPSKNRVMIRDAIKQEVYGWKKITDDLEKAKAMKKMRMLYGHMTMWEEKMTEVYKTDRPDPDNKYKTNVVDDPLPAMDINRKKDKDFVYF